MEQLVAGVALQFVLVIVLITLLRGTGTFLAVAGLTLSGFAYHFVLVQGSIFRDSDLEFIVFLLYCCNFGFQVLLPVGCLICTLINFYEKFVILSFKLSELTFCVQGVLQESVLCFIAQGFVVLARICSWGCQFSCW